MAKTIQVTKPDGTKTFVSFIQNHRICCMQAFDTRLRAIPDDKVQETFDRVKVAMQDLHYLTTIRDFDEVKAQGLREHPICKVIPGTSTAERLNLHDWEHINFQGDLAIAIVWDTRAITKIMSINDFTDADFSNLQFVYNDNCNPVMVENEMQRTEWEQTFKWPTTMTDAQFNLIKGRK